MAGRLDHKPAEGDLEGDLTVGYIIKQKREAMGTKSDFDSNQKIIVTI